MDIAVASSFENHEGKNANNREVIGMWYLFIVTGSWIPTTYALVIFMLLLLFSLYTFHFLLNTGGILCVGKYVSLNGDLIIWIKP